MADSVPGKEYSCVLMKPDAVEQDIALHVLHRIAHEVCGRIRATSTFRFTPALLREHYAHLIEHECFPRVQRYMLSGDSLATIMEGSEGVIDRIRAVLGATDPRKAAPGTIRQTYGRIVNGECHNVAHASDSQQAALAEIKRFFSEEQIRREVPELADLLFGKQH